MYDHNVTANTQTFEINIMTTSCQNSVSQHFISQTDTCLMALFEDNLGKPAPEGWNHSRF